LEKIGVMPNSSCKRFYLGTEDRGPTRNELCVGINAGEVKMGKEGEKTRKTLKAAESKGKRKPRSRRRRGGLRSGGPRQKRKASEGVKNHRDSRTEARVVRLGFVKGRI